MLGDVRAGSRTLVARLYGYNASVYAPRKICPACQPAGTHSGGVQRLRGYVLLHPQQPTQQVTQSPATAPNMVNTTGIVVGLVAFCTCVAIGGILNAVAFFRGNNKPYPATPPPVLLESEPGRPSPPVPESEPVRRIFVGPDVTPEYLFSLYESYTSIQADKLAAAFIGKWMRISGTLDEVLPVEQASIVTMERPDALSFKYVYMYFDNSWTDRLSMLKHGNPITVVGEISEIGRPLMRLRNRELE